MRHLNGLDLVYQRSVDVWPSSPINLYDTQTSKTLVSVFSSKIFEKLFSFDSEFSTDARECSLNYGK